MRFLLLETNNLDGTIPTEFGQVKKLQALLVEVDPGIRNFSAICAKGLDVFIADCASENQIQLHFVCECCTLFCSVGIRQETSKLPCWYTNWRKGYNNPIVYEFGDQVVVWGTSNDRIILFFGS
jgi:hypothetical protein